MLKTFCSHSRDFKNQPRWVWFAPGGREVPAPVEAPEAKVDSSSTGIDGGRDTADAKDKDRKETRQAQAKCNVEIGKACKEVEKEAEAGGVPFDEVMSAVNDAEAARASTRSPGDDDSGNPDGSDGDGSAVEEGGSEGSDGQSGGGGEGQDAEGYSGNTPVEGGEGNNGTETQAEDFSEFESMDEKQRFDFVARNLFGSSFREPMLNMIDEPATGEGAITDVDIFMNRLTSSDKLKNVILTDILKIFAGSLTGEQMASMKEGDINQQIVDQLATSIKQSLGMGEIGEVNEQEVQWLNNLPKIKAGKLVKQDLEGICPEIPRILSALYVFDFNKKTNTLQIKTENGFTPIKTIDELKPYMPLAIQNDFSELVDSEKDAKNNDSLRRMRGYMKVLEGARTMQEQLNNIDINQDGKGNEKKSSFSEVGRFLQLVGIAASCLKSLNGPNGFDPMLMEKAELAIEDYKAGDKIGSREKEVKKACEGLLTEQNPDIPTLAQIYKDPVGFQEQPGNEAYVGKSSSFLGEAAKERMANDLGMSAINNVVISTTNDYLSITGSTYNAGQRTVELSKNPGENTYTLNVTKPSTDAENPDPVRILEPIKNISDVSGPTILAALSGRFTETPIDP